MRLSKNLHLSEVTASNTAKRQGIDNTPNAWQKSCLSVIANKVFQPARDHFGKPLFVSSGFRSIKLNKAIGGAATSQHTKGQALDLDADRFKGFTNLDLFMFIYENLQFDQLIWEGGTDASPAWVHVSYVSEELNRCEVLRMVKNEAGKSQYSIWEP